MNKNNFFPSWVMTAMRVVCRVALFRAGRGQLINKILEEKVLEIEFKTVV